MTKSTSLKLIPFQFKILLNKNFMFKIEKEKDHIIKIGIFARILFINFI